DLRDEQSRSTPCNDGRAILATVGGRLCKKSGGNSENPTRIAKGHPRVIARRAQPDAAIHRKCKNNNNKDKKAKRKGYL
ncbi:MAG: hypothetical protein FWD01_05000, partial [Defluviitaleaceae bacterium]|nr:hypothetical protein [Defluviitaleaceae bacterium]